MITIPILPVKNKGYNWSPLAYGCGVGEIAKKAPKNLSGVIFLGGAEGQNRTAETGIFSHNHCHVTPKLLFYYKQLKLLDMIQCQFERHSRLQAAEISWHSLNPKNLSKKN